MTTQKVVTRFAPSPTGFLHIGGARTALFNWLYARHMGGDFKLRIEDTDRTRSTPQATHAILEGMAWLGLDHDGDVVYQHANAPEHVKTAHELLERGAAYRCYCTPQELETLREASRVEGHAFRSPYRNETLIKDAPYTIRFRVPDGQTHIQDNVQGDVKWQNENFDDLVLLRADGSPTYMLAVVVDDHNMGITHVIRGDDHLINAGRQSLIYHALGWDTPNWTHVPLIHGPDGKKLSKRHGALAIEAYKDMGYLPSGLRNYLLKLGWARGDVEIFLGDAAIENFNLEGLNNAPARLDFDKMDFINGQHVLNTDDTALLDAALPFLETLNTQPLPPELHDKIKLAMPTLKPRSKTLVELAEQARYLILNRPLEITGKAKKSLKNDAIGHIGTLILQLQAIEGAQWTAERLQTVLTKYAADNDIGFGKIGQPVRAALTGGAPSPDLSWVLALLGKSETLARLQDVVTVKRDTKDPHGK